MSLLSAALQRAAATMRGGTPNQQVANRFPGMTPNDYVAQNFMPPTANQYVANNFPGPSANQHVAQNFPLAMAQGSDAQPHVPMPTARPTHAPQALTPMSFFQRNAAMMRDPVSGMFIDPANAARAQASFTTPGAVGPTSVGGAPLQSAPRPNGGLLSQMIWRLNGNS